MGTIIGNFFRSITKLVGRVFNTMKAETKELIPIAISVVEGIKRVMDSPVDDIVLFVVKGAIPGTADDVLIDKIKVTVETWLPKILKELRMVEGIANIEDTNEQLKAILAEFKLSSNESKDIFYHGFASLILEKLSDGKLTWSESVVLTEYYFRNYTKK